MSKLNDFQRRRQEYNRQAVASKEPEVATVKTHGVNVYPEVFKKADLVKVLLDSMVKELKKCTNIGFEQVSFSEIRDVVKNDGA